MATKKTTLMLDEELIAEFKIRAAQSGRSLSSMVAEAMRIYDLSADPKPRPERWTLPVLGTGKPMQPGVDLSSNAAIWELLDGDLPLEKQR